MSTTEETANTADPNEAQKSPHAWETASQGTFPTDIDGIEGKCRFYGVSLPEVSGNAILFVKPETAYSTHGNKTHVINAGDVRMISVYVQYMPAETDTLCMVADLADADSVMLATHDIPKTYGHKDLDYVTKLYTMWANLVMGIMR